VDGEALDGARLDLRVRRREHAGRQLHRVGEQRLERIAAAAVDDVAICFRPSRSFSTSAWSCGVVPTGGVETLYLSGSFFTIATELFHRP